MESATLDGRVAVVTGAAGGIGARFVGGLAAQGAHVVAVDRDGQRLEATVAKLRTQGASVEAVAADVTDEAAVERIAASTAQLDIWVNNAGVFPVRPALDVRAAQWDEAQAVNVRGVFLGARAAGARMCAQGSGTIVNIASVGAIAVRPLLAEYCTAKAAVTHLSRALAAEWGPAGVRVNVIAPGFIATDMLRWITDDPDALERETATVPLRRIGTTDDVLGALLFLVSDAAAYVTGNTIVVDGGLTLG